MSEMRNRPLILVSAILLAGAILLALRGELHAHGSQHANGLAGPPTECGFWGPSMADGMSCR
jgi:hypothetical protein